jgi:hypothetical protein
LAVFYYETMHGDTKTLDWDKIPPGDYKMVNNKIVSVNDGQSATEIAADNFMSALQRLADA